MTISVTSQASSSLSSGWAASLLALGYALPALRHLVNPTRIVVKGFKYRRREDGSLILVNNPPRIKPPGTGGRIPLFRCLQRVRLISVSQRLVSTVELVAKVALRCTVVSISVTHLNSCVPCPTHVLIILPGLWTYH